MKADMTQVSVYRGSRVRAQVRNRDGLESSFFFFLVKYYHDQRDKSYSLKIFKVIFPVNVVVIALTCF